MRRQGQLAVLLTIFGEYRLHLGLLVILGVVSATLDGISINALIPLLSFLLGDGESLPGDFISTAMQDLFALGGIEYTFRNLLIFVGILIVSRSLVLAVFAYVRARITGSFIYREATGLLRSTLQGAWGFLMRQKAGTLQNTLFWDVKRAGGLLEVLAQFIQSCTGFIIYFFVALSISPLITLVTLGVGGVLLFLLHPLVRKTTRFGEETSVVEKSYAHHLIESVAGLKAIKASGVERSVEREGEGYLSRLRSVIVKTAMSHSLGTTLFQPFSFLFVAVLFSISYQLPSFNLAAFAATLYLIQKIFTYLQSTQASLHAIADLVPFARGITRFKAELGTAREDARRDGRSFRYTDALTFKDVTLSYKGDDRALKGISFRVARGELIGIIGPSGGGKTSIADLILRLFSPTSGSIHLDAEPAGSFSRESWHRAVGYVSQDIFLINASVRENIRFWDDSVSEEDIRRAAKQAHILDVIEKLPKGFDTLVGDRGVELSVGQRQRIVIARALARNPSLLILDEATSALDSDSETAIKQVVEELRGEVTLIVIAHRISTILRADRIIVLKDGRIEEEDSPSQMLLREDSYLSRMQRMQASS